MAFDNVRLPDNIERGAKSLPRFQTSIITLGAGSEQRNANWSQQRLKFDISYGLESKDDYSAVVTFFYARLGKARGFLFKDWSDYEVVNQQLAIGDGVQTQFQLRKTYTSVVVYSRIILAPVNGTVTMFVGGVPTAATVNYTTGVVTFSVAPADDAVIAATFEFDVPVRFDSDELPISVELWNVGGIDSIELVELSSRA